MDDIVFIGDWIKEKVLGKGSFGIVVLWKHKRTDELLAIKTCIWGDELTEKHRERWTKEVEMLENCNNPNIVGTKELPSEFVIGLANVNPSRLPMLCMEYCSGGDLRQVLNKPDSCAGLKEFQVRQILSDICNAMQFLHKNKITHRDLKPENIVLHILNNNEDQIQNKVIYKLIDLGYAKEIDSNSICASFVGTLQYLAPEFFYSKTYSNSVDFWSFGLLSFEVICGTRPFLPYMTPGEWMPHVKKKAHENICVYETFHGDIEYSNEILPENNVSKPFKTMIEKWLQIVLEWDPKLRGRDSPSKVTFSIPQETKETSSNIVVFQSLKNILSKIIIKIFSVPTLSDLAFEVNDKTSILNLKSYIQEEINIPIDSQILISQVSYMTIGDEELAVKYFNEQNNIMIYLFSKDCIIKNDLKPVVPKDVQRCLENPKTLYNSKNSQNLYKSGLYFVMAQKQIYESLLNGLIVRAESLKHESRELLLKHNDVDKNVGKLIAKQETVIKIIETGKSHIENLRKNGIGTNYLGGFETIIKEAESYFCQIEKLQIAWSQLCVRLKSGARRSNEILSVDLNNFIAKYNYQTIFANAVTAYISHKRSQFFSEQKNKEKQCSDILKICYESLKLRSQILQEIKMQTFILKLIDLSNEFSKIAQVITNIGNYTETLVSDITSVVHKLSNCMWATISILCSNVDSLPDLPYSVVSFQKKDFKLDGSDSGACITKK